jgi:hypothetical protein
MQLEGIIWIRSGHAVGDGVSGGGIDDDDDDDDDDH